MDTLYGYIVLGLSRKVHELEVNTIGLMFLIPFFRYEYRCAYPHKGSENSELILRGMFDILLHIFLAMIKTA